MDIKDKNRGRELARIRKAERLAKVEVKAVSEPKKGVNNGNKKNKTSKG